MLDNAGILLKGIYATPICTQSLRELAPPDLPAPQMHSILCVKCHVGLMISHHSEIRTLKVMSSVCECCTNDCKELLFSPVRSHLGWSHLVAPERHRSVILHQHSARTEVGCITNELIRLIVISDLQDRCTTQSIL